MTSNKSIRTFKGCPGWRSLSSVGASIGDLVEGAGRNSQVLWISHMPRGPKCVCQENVPLPGMFFIPVCGSSLRFLAQPQRGG